MASLNLETKASQLKDEVLMALVERDSREIVRELIGLLGVAIATILRLKRSKSSINGFHMSIARSRKSSVTKWKRMENGNQRRFSQWLDAEDSPSRMAKSRLHPTRTIVTVCDQLPVSSTITFWTLAKLTRKKNCDEIEVTHHKPHEKKQAMFNQKGAYLLFALQRKMHNWWCGCSANWSSVV